MNIQVKRLQLSNLHQLQQIGRRTFIESFSEGNTEANMAKYLEESFAEEKITAELSNPHSEFYFAVFNEEIIGYLKINFGEAQTEKKFDNAMEIERIYVLSAFHGKKVGQILCDHALQIARDKNIQFIWLGVWEKNPRAIRFYQKNGFTAFDKHIFKLGDDEQTDIMMGIYATPMKTLQK